MWIYLSMDMMIKRRIIYDLQHMNEDKMFQRRRNFFKNNNNFFYEIVPIKNDKQYLSLMYLCYESFNGFGCGYTCRWIWWQKKNYSLRSTYGWGQDVSKKKKFFKNNTNIFLRIVYLLLLYICNYNCIQLTFFILC